jgi:nitrite reductase (NO-forming)
MPTPAIMKSRAAVLAIGVLFTGLAATACDDASSGGRPTQTDTLRLVHAPNVPPPVGRRSPRRLVVQLETRELRGRLADGVEYTFWTFGGRVPGPMMRVRVGDEVEFHLNNHPSSSMPHNIDLHAVTGPGGGAGASLTAPGHSSVFSFKAVNPGLYVYHCATAPVGMHIANGMYGIILVEPAGGLTPVDREFYVMQSEFYTTGAHGAPGLQPFDMTKAIREDPEYVVFNGSVGAIMGDSALKASVGERVRMFVGNGGPNLVSSFHVIGEIFDDVYTEAGTVANQHNVQTTLVPAGGAAIVEFGLEVPGSFLLVDHSIFRAFNKGALGALVVEGPADSSVYSGRQLEHVYQPEGGVIQTVPSAAAAAVGSMTPAELLARGEQVYGTTCAACHQPTGVGIAGVFPPLSRSDWLMADRDRAIGAVMHGLSGRITVNGQAYDGVMPALSLSDADIASVLTYVRRNFGNGASDVVSVADVARVRASGRFRPAGMPGH